jgi:hypothetical protein
MYLVALTTLFSTLFSNPSKSHSFSVDDQFLHRTAGPSVITYSNCVLVNYCQIKHEETKQSGLSSLNLNGLKPIYFNHSVLENTEERITQMKIIISTPEEIIRENQLIRFTAGS